MLRDRQTDTERQTDRHGGRDTKNARERDPILTSGGIKQSEKESQHGVKQAIGRETDRLCEVLCSEEHVDLSRTPTTPML